DGSRGKTTSASYDSEFQRGNQVICSSKVINSKTAGGMHEQVTFHLYAGYGFSARDSRIEREGTDLAREADPGCYRRHGWRSRSRTAHDRTGRRTIVGAALHR